MSPLKKETIQAICRDSIFAEGDEQDPGWWKHLSNRFTSKKQVVALEREAKKSGKKRINDIPVNSYDVGDLGEILPQDPKLGKLVGVWEEMDGSVEKITVTRKKT